MRRLFTAACAPLRALARELRTSFQILSGRHPDQQALPARPVHARDLAGSHVVYVIFAAGTTRVKVGRTSNIARRLRALQTGCPHELIVARVFLVIDHEAAIVLEKSLHEVLAPKRVRGEWFDLDGWSEPAERAALLEQLDGFALAVTA